jgi:ribosomal protein S18 acetylase RimI-like enzyme
VSDFDRAFDFMTTADMAGSRREPFRFGTAVFTPERPLRYDSNYLLVERVPAHVTAQELADEAERVQGGAGLPHRLLLFRDARLGGRFAPELAGAGWRHERHILMAHRRPAERAADVGLVSEVTADVAEQLLAAKEHIPVESRFFAVLVDDEVASYSDLYLDGDIGQVEDVATLPEYRGRGYASAVVMRAVQEAHTAGADLVFLVADAEDWPKELYRRLGFDEIGENVKLVKTDL